MIGKLQQVGEICEFKYGRALPERTRQPGNMPVFGSNGNVGWHTSAITDGAAIVLGRKGSVGEVHYSEKACWPIDTTYYIDKSATNEDLKWLTYALRSLNLEELNKATGVPGLNRNDAYELLLAVPSPDEQRKIAAILDQANDLRRKRRLALQKLNELPQAIFREMFGHLAHAPADWLRVPLSEVVSRDTIITYGIVQAGDEYEGGVPYIRTGDIVNGELSDSDLRHTDPAIAARFSRSRVETGEIVMSIRATVGTVALVPPVLNGANLTQGTARISPGPDIDNQFLLEYLRSDSAQEWIKKQVKGATFREITLARLRELPVLVPPLYLQKNFAARRSEIVALLFTQNKQLAELDRLFASLQHHAFAGTLAPSSAAATLASLQRINPATPLAV